VRERKAIVKIEYFHIMETFRDWPDGFLIDRIPIPAVPFQSCPRCSRIDLKASIAKAVFPTGLLLTCDTAIAVERCTSARAFVPAPTAVRDPQAFHRPKCLAEEG
jgi:hypothetical protein